MLYLIALLLVVVLAGCGGLGSEPPIVATVTPPTGTPVAEAFPANAPDVALGAAVYAQHCTACHGVGGAGDGPLAQSGQVQNVGNFTQPEAASRQRPSEWFATITNGRIENLMPPWRDALTAEERWAVAYYTYTLHYDQAALEQGATIYADHCAECHGETGLGDGERAAELSGEVTSLLNLSSQASLSDNVLYNIITEGVGDPNDGMPSFLNELSEGERVIAAEYSRILSFRNVESVAQVAQPPVTTPEVEATTEAVSQITITGTARNGTSGGSVPTDQSVSLFLFAADGTPQQFTATIDTNGGYSFVDVPFAAENTYAVSAAYRERVFSSALTPGSALSPINGVATLDLTLYDLTEDPAVLIIRRMVTQVNVAEDRLEVAQVINIENTSDRAYSTSELTPDGRPISLVVPLPPGAAVPGFNEQGRYVYAPEQFTVVDTLPVLPGASHLVQLVYFVPFNGDAIIEQPVSYAMDATARLLVRPENVVVSGDQFPSLGQETVGQTAYAAYGGALSLPAGGVLRYDLRGIGGASALGSAAETIVPASNLPVLLIVGIAVEAVLIGGLVYWYARRRRGNVSPAAAPTITPQDVDEQDGNLNLLVRNTPENQQLVDGFIRQIAELDADHQAGNIDDATYQAQRTALKRRLREVLGG